MRLPARVYAGSLFVVCCAHLLPLPDQNIVRWTPMIDYTSQPFYNVFVNGFSVNNQPLGVTSSQFASTIIDSGTTLALIPSSVITGTGCVAPLQFSLFSPDTRGQESRRPSAPTAPATPLWACATRQRATPSSTAIA